MDPTLSPEAAYRRLASGASDAFESYLAKHGIAAPSVIVDVGCSTGISSRWLAGIYTEASITGIDLSPYFLAVAEWEER
jgi:trans-aconitate methyltransferase